MFLVEDARNVRETCEEIHRIVVRRGTLTLMCVTDGAVEAAAAKAENNSAKSTHWSTTLPAIFMPAPKSCLPMPSTPLSALC